MTTEQPRNDHVTERRLRQGAGLPRLLHSGTVSTALTAGVHGIRALTVSLDVALRPDGDRHWETATAPLHEVLTLLLDMPEGTMLSLNVPDRPVGDLGAIRHARLAPFGTVQTRVDTAGDDHWHLREIESDELVDGDTDAASSPPVVPP